MTTDLASYYEIAYAPQSAEARRQVPQDRGEDRPQERGGAPRAAATSRCRPTDTAPLLPYELPLLAAAAATPPPHAFDFQAGAFRFQRRRRAAGSSPFVVEVPIAALAVHEDKKAKRYAATSR